MKKKIYYILPFIIIPLLALLAELLDNWQSMSSFAFCAGLIIVCVIIGNLTPTHKKFDYLMTVFMPLSFFCTMFVAAFVEKNDLETRFNLTRAIYASVETEFLIIYVIMAAVTFLASFKPLRVLKRIREG